MKKEDYNKKLEQLKEEFKDQIPKDGKFYISVKDKSLYVRENETHNDRFSKELNKTLDNWKEKGYGKYEGNPEDLPTKIFIRFIKKDGKVLNGGFLVSNKVKDEGYMYLRGIGGRGFGVQMDDVKDIYYRKDHYEKAKQKQKEAEKNKEEKKDEKQKKKEKKKEPEPEPKDEPKEEPQPEPKPEKPKKLTDDEKDKILNDYYYDKGFTYGRDRLHKKLIDDGHKITRTYVDKWLKQQELYQLTKPSKKRTTFTPIQSKAPFNVVQIDLYSYGNKIFLNAIDIFSKLAFSRLIKNKTADEVVKTLSYMINNQMPEKPKMIQSDNGTEFKNELMSKFLQEQNIKQIFSTPNTPQSQGQIERFNGTLKGQLEKLTLQKKRITQKAVDTIINNYNSTYHSTTKLAPNDAVMPENAEKVIENKRKTADNFKPRVDDINVGDSVRMATTKSKIEKTPLKWTEEIFIVKRILKPKDLLKPIKYKLVDSNGNEIKGYAFREELQKVQNVQNPDKVEVKYEVERFLKMRIVKNKKPKKNTLEILVKWKGYPVSEATWVDKQSLIQDLGQEQYDKLFKRLK
jgi:hypothetical protein